MPDILFFDKEVQKPFYDFIQADCGNLDVNQRKIKQAFILPLKKCSDDKDNHFFRGGVTDKDGNFVEESAHRKETISGEIVGAYDFSTKDVPLIHKNVIYGGILNNHFGHFLVENTGRLWCWLEHKEEDLDIVFLNTKKKIIPQFWTFMSLLGIPKNKIIILDQISQFDSVLVPSQAHILDVSYNPKFITPFQYISSLLPEAPKKKIYLSRTKLKHVTSCLGEKQIEKLFADNGFSIVYPEKLPLHKQIEIIKNASVIAGVNGTALHMALFATPETKIIVLERSDHFVPEQMIINKALHADFYHIGVNLNPFPVEHSIGPTLLGITQNLIDFCSAHYMHYDPQKVNFVKNSDAKKFVKEFLRNYSLPDNNKKLAPLAPVLARRLSFMAQAFAPLKKVIKLKVKHLIKKAKSF